MTFGNDMLSKYNIIPFYGDINIKNIINDFIKYNSNKEPFFIINIGQIIQLYNQWIEYFPNIKPYYAVKCNPDPIIIKTLYHLGAYFDCASQNEIKLILELTNNKPDKIIFANPCKMVSHLVYAEKQNIQLMTFDCSEELYKIKMYHPYSKLLLRLSVDDTYSICKFNSKFGCKIENVSYLINLIKKLDLNLIGFSFHVGSGCKSANSYYDAIHITKIAYDIALKNGIHIQIIDIGGGFPGVCVKDGVNIKEISNKIIEAQNFYFKKEIETNTIQFIAEPGRYFVEKSHTLVLNVICKKRETIINENTKENEEIIIYYINDGIYGSFNCIYFDHKNPSIFVLDNNKNKSTLYKSKIFGPTCDSIDLICDNIMLPELDIGDYIYVENFGAYTTSASSSFNGFKTTENKYILFNEQKI